MKKFLLCIIATFSGLSTFAQTSWQRAFTFSNAYSIAELSDGSFICSLDSMGNSYLIRLSSTGQRLTSFAPVIRTNGETISSIVADPRGGYAVCGTSPDTSGATYTNGFFARIDTNGVVTDTLIFPPGTVSGSGRCVRVGPDSNYVVGTFDFNGAGSGAAHATKVLYPATATWSDNGTAGLTSSSIEIDSENRTIFTNYHATAAAIAYVDLLDSAGNLLHTFSVTDTILGGSLVFASTVGLGTGHRYGFGCNLSPNAYPNSVIYFTCLDTAFNQLWTKIIDWGQSISLSSIIPTPDSGFVLLLNMDDTLRLYKVNSAGDSVWAKSYSGLGHTHANYMRGTSDGGFIICGTTDSIPGNVSAYVLKVDSDGGFFPVMISAPSTIFCPGDSVAINATPGFTSYLWSNGDTHPSVIVSQPGDYWVAVTDDFGFHYVSDTISLTQYAVTVPSITQSGDTLISSAGISWQWIDGNGPVPGANMQTYIPPASGQYWVVVVDSNGCEAISNLYIFTINKVDEINDAEMKVLQRNKTVEIRATEKIQRLEIFDLEGKIVYSEKADNRDFIFSLQWASSGSYVLVVKTENRFYRRLINITE